MRMTIDLPDDKENGFVLDKVLAAVFPGMQIMRHFDDNRQIMEYHTTVEWRTTPYKIVDCCNGTWIFDPYNTKETYSYKCNKCNHYNMKPTNFCPNCGAKMEEKKIEKIPMYPSDSWRCDK